MQASINTNKGFIEDVKCCLSETKRPVSRHSTTSNVENLPNNKECENSASLPLHEPHLHSKTSPDTGQEDVPGKIHDMEQDDLPQNTHNIEENALCGVVHDDIQPNDSV